jgi:hypothetical protein
MGCENARPLADAMAAPRPTSRASAVYSLMLVGIVLAPFILGGAYHILTRPDLPGVAAWLQTQNLAPGEHDAIELPAQFRLTSANGTVDVVVSPTGRIAFLLKTSIGWKHNYEGYVYSTEPLQPQEFFLGYGDREAIELSKGEQPFVERKIDDHTYEVFFDLG